MENNNAQHWTARFIVGIIILVLTFIGLILTNMKAASAWRFWQIITVIIALLALGLSIYLKRLKKTPTPVLIWHEILHWLGLIGSVYIISIYVDIGIISPFIGALGVLALLAQAIFLAGVYIESTFLFIGIALALFAISIAWMEAHLFLIVIPILIIVIFTIVYFVRRKH
ncbi:transmembrane protein [Legionella gratiana]|uniref:Transmembrane protein n=1 Tax=Legionella gratiana TaxID=45066 RepID=A0A378J4Y3_9GAMM|nr:hypothetical protein [Legionella gratiana]KTD13090.1 transmembrane protein [Legionella gratiana]STX42061.1 transmembrane protein [Legionella gratiana]